jgi:nitric oxide reductase NorQ protein
MNPAFVAIPVVHALLLLGWNARQRQKRDQERKRHEQTLAAQRDEQEQQQRDADAIARLVAQRQEKLAGSSLLRQEQEIAYRGNGQSGLALAAIGTAGVNQLPELLRCPVASGATDLVSSACLVEPADETRSDVLHQLPDGPHTGAEGVRMHVGVALREMPMGREEVRAQGRATANAVHEPPLVTRGWGSAPNLAALRAAVRVPPRDPHFVVAPEAKSFFDAALRRSKRAPVNLLLVGEPGSGKTSLARWFAATHERPFFLFDCSLIDQVNVWWGSRELDGTCTRFYPSALAYALQLGDAIVVLDEVNRTPTHVRNPLLPVLDDRRQTYLDALGEELTVAPGTIIIGTANLEGDIGGTFDMGRALSDRFASVLEVKMPDRDTQVRIVVNKTGCDRRAAEKLVEILQRINEMTRDRNAPSALSRPLGLRAVLEAADWIVAGFPIGAACRVAMINQYSPEGDEASERFRVEQAVRGILGKER